MVVEPDDEEDEDAEQVRDDEGVDRSLIRWMLSLTPTGRLEVVQGAIDLVASVRDAEPRTR